MLAVGLYTTAFSQNYKPGITLKPGAKYQVKSYTKASITQEAMGQTMEIPMETTVIEELEIKDAVNGGYQSGNTTKRIVFSANMMGQEMNYDSDKPEDRNGDMGKQMSGMVDKTTTFTIDKNGNIIRSTVVKPAAEEVGVDMMSNLTSQMGLGGDGTSVAFNLFQSAKSIKVGDTFTDSTIIINDGTIKSYNTYTLASVKNNMAEFSVTGKGSIAKKMETQGMEMNMSSDNTSVGTIVVDMTTGLLAKKTVEIETMGNVEVQGMKIPVTGKSTTSIEVTAIK